MSTEPFHPSPAPWVMSVWPGSAAEFHERDLPGDGRRHVWLYQGGPAVVVGSSQAESVIDHEVAAELGFPVVRRRSGGGVVLVDPNTLWCDVIIPSGDPLWLDDVGRSMHWIGTCWAATLAAFGVVTEVHYGSYEATPLSRLVCFGGLGAGEVHVGGAKLVGISQRRSRTGARFQCALQGGRQVEELALLVAAAAAVVSVAQTADQLASLLAPHMTSLREIEGLAPVPSLEALTTEFLRTLSTV